MYYIIWLENAVRYDSTAFVNPSSIHALELDTNKEIVRRLYYPFEKLDFFVGTSNDVINDIKRNWVKFFNKISKDFDKDATLVFAFYESMRNFKNAIERSKADYELKDTLCIGSKLTIHNSKLRDLEGAGAKNVWLLYNEFKKLSDSDIEDIIKDSEARGRGKVRNNRLERSKIGAVRTRNNSYEIIDKQLDRIAEELGFKLIRRGGMLRIQGISGEFVIGMLNRPMMVYRIENGQQFKISSNNIYSPLDALIFLKGLEEREISKLHAYVSSDT